MICDLAGTTCLLPAAFMKLPLPYRSFGYWWCGNFPVYLLGLYCLLHYYPPDSVDCCSVPYGGANPPTLNELPGVYVERRYLDDSLPPRWTVRLPAFPGLLPAACVTIDVPSALNRFFTHTHLPSQFVLPFEHYSRFLQYHVLPFPRPLRFCPLPQRLRRWRSNLPHVLPSCRATYLQEPSRPAVTIYSLDLPTGFSMIPM